MFCTGREKEALFFFKLNFEIILKKEEEIYSVYGRMCPTIIQTQFTFTKKKKRDKNTQEIKNKNKIKIFFEGKFGSLIQSLKVIKVQMFYLNVEGFQIVLIIWMCWKQFSSQSRLKLINSITVSFFVSESEFQQTFINDLKYILEMIMNVIWYKKFYIMRKCKDFCKMYKFTDFTPLSWIMTDE